MRFKYLAGIALGAVIVGCDDAALMKKWAPPEAEANARSYVEFLRQGKFDRIEHDLDASVTDSNVRETFAKMAAIFPTGDPVSVKVVGAHTFHGQAYSTTDITLEYQFPGKWVLASIATQTKGDVSTVTGFHVNPMADSLENLNKFSLLGKSAGQYLILICGVCALLFSFYVLVLCIRTKVGKTKWLWMLFILTGLVRLAVNWTTGEFTFMLFALNLPCFAATRPLYGPWTLALYLPVGAILFINHRRKLEVKGVAVEPPMQVQS
ncbi:MAG TPA: hypothetical protein VJW94_14120 [Candidatus Acidoferrum sp.]|nr:hypothetical protein [Candidatus Acidoferrum sp.]